MVLAGTGALAHVDLLIAQGTTLDYRFRYSTGDPAAPVDLTGWTAAAQVRNRVGGQVWLAVATGGQGITLDAGGNIAIAVPYAATIGPDWDARDVGVWDLELTSPAGRRIRLAAGTVTVSHDVTRDG